MVQMVQWLTHQEAVHQFTGYLQWAMPHYAIQQDLAEDTDDDDDENKPEEDENDENEAEEPLTYQIMKTAPLPKIIISTLTHDYKVPNFLYHLQNFMNKQSIAPQKSTNTHINHPCVQTGCIKTAILERGHVFAAEGCRPCSEGSHREGYSKGHQKSYSREF